MYVMVIHVILHIMNAQYYSIYMCVFNTVSMYSNTNELTSQVMRYDFIDNVLSCRNTHDSNNKTKQYIYANA